MLHNLILKTRIAIKTLRKDQHGAVAVEYALILPVFLTLTIGGFELGRVYMVNSTLEGAIANSSRIAMTGNLPAGHTTKESYIESIIRDNLANVGVKDGIIVSMKIYDSFANVGEPEPFTDTNSNQEYDPGECFTDVNGTGVWDDDMGVSGLGGQENIMVMNISVTLPYMTGWFQSVLGGKGTITLSSATAVRNEPFGGISWEPSSAVIC